MCTCASCSHTDSFASKGFAAWPRGNPAGRKSVMDYAVHVRYAQQWGKGHGKPECSSKPRTWHSRAEDPHALYKWPDADLATEVYIAQFCRSNGLKMPDAAETAPARKRTPAKARDHFREPDRRPEAINDIGKSATILAMPKPKKSIDSRRGRGRPAIPGRFVVVKLEERLIQKAEKLGAGSVSAGIRKALSG